MAKQRGSTTSERMKDLRERISRWRSTRQKQRPMPAPLWDDATALARELGVYRVKSVLGLNYDSLKKRVDDAPTCVGAPRFGGDFVELTGAQLLGSPSVGGGPTVEVLDGRGGRLTVRLGAGGVLDVALLVAAFRGQPT